MTTALRSVPAIIEAAPLETQIREAARAYQEADVHAAELEQSSIAARATANEARAACNAKLSELAQLLGKAKRQHRGGSWESYLESLGVDLPQLAFEWLASDAPAEREPANDVEPEAPSRGRPLRLDDDVMAIKIAMSCETEALARYAEARVDLSRNPESARAKVAAAHDQIAMARRNLDEILGAASTSRAMTSGRDLEANRTRLRALYHERAQRGECVKCGSPALAGQVRCHVHRHELQGQQQRRKELADPDSF